MTQPRDHTQRWRRYWDRHARSYDRQMQFMDRVVFGDSRQWACSRVSGAVLEVAVGTGLNIDMYPNHVRLTGLDFSEQMLAVARARACAVGREVDLRQGDAQALPFDDESFRHRSLHVWFVLNLQRRHRFGGDDTSSATRRNTDLN